MTGVSPNCTIGFRLSIAIDAYCCCSAYSFYLYWGGRLGLSVADDIEYRDLFGTLKKLLVSCGPLESELESSSS